MIKGFNLNDERFIKGNKFDKRFFDELLERIKLIRVSERMAYQKTTDLFIATSIDYDKNSEEASKEKTMTMNDWIKIADDLLKYRYKKIV